VGTGPSNSLPWRWAIARPEADGTLLELRAETYWPRGLGVVGKLVEAAILSPREGRKELGRLKEFIENNPVPDVPNSS
jgi:hypothetical protein